MGRGRYAKMAEKMNDYSTKQTKNWVIEPKNYNTTASDYLTKTPSAQKIGEKLQ
jgi:hypothetical protein